LVGVSAVVLTTLAGCGAVGPVAGSTPAVPRDQTALRRGGSITLLPQYSVQSRSTQAVVTPYTKDSINHVLVTIFRVNGSNETLLTDDTGRPITTDIARADLDKPITFSHLDLFTFYRVKCFAFKAPTTDARDLISTVDSGSQTLIVVTDDDHPSIAPLKVKLIDVPFDGEATASGIVVTAGGISHPDHVSITSAAAE